MIALAVNFITTPRNTTAVVGKSTVLRCNATGLPTPDISWGRERGKLDKKRFRQLANGNLHIRDIKMTDAGQYFCIAANIHDLKEVKVTLRVIGKRFVCTTIFRKLMTSFASCKRIHDSLGFWMPGTGFEILSQWKLQSSFQSLEGFRISCAVLRIPKPRISDLTTQISRIPNSTAEISRTWNPDSRMWSDKSLERVMSPLLLSFYHVSSC